MNTILNNLKMLDSIKYLLPLLFSILLIQNTNAQDINVSDGVVFEGEPFLSINPSNTQHIIVAWMGHVLGNRISIKSKVSFDGGENWSSESIIPHEFSGATTADPSVEFDAEGNVFLCYVDFNVLTDSGAVFIRKSINGGLDWGAPVEVINIQADGNNKPADRPWMKIDRSSGVNRGNIYVVTMPPRVFGFIPPPYHPYLTRSIDGGASFEPWKYLDAPNWLAGSWIPQPSPFPAISQNGTLHSVYPSLVFLQSSNARYFMASTSDGGNTFTHSLIMEQDTSTIVADPDAKKGYPLIADPSDNDHLVFFSLLDIHGDADVFMWETFDAGTTWSDPIRINDDPIANKRMQDLIWADFDDDGDLIATWRDRRNGADSTFAAATEIWAAVRPADSLHFSPNFRLSDTLAIFDPVLTSAGNDFMCVDLVNDTIHAAWGDTRSGSLSIWFKKISMDGTTVSINQISSGEQIDVSLFPNPAISSVAIKGKAIKQLLVLNQKGKVVLEQVNHFTEDEVLLDIHDLREGIYFIQIHTEKGFVTKKLIKQKA